MSEFFHDLATLSCHDRGMTSAGDHQADASQERALQGPGAAERVPVRRRKVFYIPGFDPFPIRRYRELYRRESRRQAAISGHDLTMEGAPGKPGRWRVIWREQGAPVTQSDFEVLEWSDIVRRKMAGGVLAGYHAMLTTLWHYLASGTFFRLMRLRKGPVLAALYPIAMLFGELLLAVLVGIGLAISALHLPGLLPVSLPDALTWALALFAGLGGGYGVLWWFWKHDGRFYAHYLMHDYAYTASEKGAWPAELDRRIDDFAQRIASALEDESIDEVLVIGHSSGAHLAIAALGRLELEGRLARARGRLGLLTLGHVVPMVSFLPNAQALRADLARLAVSESLFWLDVSAPGDGCTFALCDPVAVTGVLPEGCEHRWPLVISAAFSQTLSPESWKKLRRRYFRLHFQYLCAFERPNDYDYFAITAGPMRISARFAARKPSPSRLTQPLSRWRDRGEDACESDRIPARSRAETVASPSAAPHAGSRLADGPPAQKRAAP